MMSNYKIIFTGPSGSGKTTAIGAVSDIPPVKTDEASDETLGYVGKSGITVALDYGMIHLSREDKVHLFGTPGQERFDFMWEILVQGGLGLVLLIDNTSDDPFEDMHFFLNAFKDFIHETRVAIGVTRMDLNPTPSIEDYYQQIKKTGLRPPIFEVDGRSKEDVSLLLQALMYSLAPGMNA